MAISLRREIVIPLAQEFMRYAGPHGGPGCPFGFFHPGFLWLAALLGFVIVRRSGGFRRGGRSGPAPTSGPQHATNPPAPDGPEWPAPYPEKAPLPTQGQPDDASRGPIGYF